MYALDNVANAGRALSEYDVLCFILAASAKSYFGTVCMFAKMLSVVLFLRQSPLLGVIYIILCISKYQYVIRGRISSKNLLVRRTSGFAKPLVRNEIYLSHPRKS